MSKPTKVFLSTKFAKRPATPTDKYYLCYEPTTPLWEKELYYVQDSLKRTWLVHEADIPPTEEACHAFAKQVNQEYTPHSPQILKRREHRPLIVQIVLSKASNFDELSQLLGTVKMERSKEAAHDED